MGIFTTHTITLMHANGEIVKQHLPVQLDPVNLPLNLEVQSTIPTDWYDVITQGWVAPVPLRTDYLVDETTGAKYSMFSTVFQGINNLQFRVSKPSGSTP